MRMNKHQAGLWLAMGVGLALSACARSPDSATAGTSVVSAEMSPVALPPVLVHKDPACGCCHLWVEHLRKAGFQVEARDEDDLNPIKQRLGVPHGKGSCHTAEIDGYVIEGHVPVQDIHRLLVERPRARGLVLAGMPAGSPGMELPDDSVSPFTVELVLMDGSTQAFSQHGGEAAP